MPAPWFGALAPLRRGNARGGAVIRQAVKCSKGRFNAKFAPK
jgi:hypothetical protein